MIIFTGTGRTVLTGCDKLTEISVSEETINSAVAENIRLNKQIGMDGVADADFTPGKLLTEIGREEPQSKTDAIGLLKLVRCSVYGFHVISMSQLHRISMPPAGQSMRMLNYQLHIGSGQMGYPDFRADPYISTIH